MIEVPYLAAFNLTRAFLPEMLARRSGAIACITSPASLHRLAECDRLHRRARTRCRGFTDALRADVHGSGLSRDPGRARHGREPLLGAQSRKPRVRAGNQPEDSRRCSRLRMRPKRSFAGVAKRDKRTVVKPAILRALFLLNALAPRLVASQLRRPSAKPASRRDAMTLAATPCAMMRAVTSRPASAWASPHAPVRCAARRFPCDRPPRPTRSASSRSSSPTAITASASWPWRCSIRPQPTTNRPPYNLPFFTNLELYKDAAARARRRQAPADHAVAWARLQPAAICLVRASSCRARLYRRRALSLPRQHLRRDHRLSRQQALATAGRYLPHHHRSARRSRHGARRSIPTASALPAIRKAASPRSGSAAPKSTAISTSPSSKAGATTRRCRNISRDELPLDPAPALAVHDQRDQGRFRHGARHHQGVRHGRGGARRSHYRRPTSRSARATPRRRPPSNAEFAAKYIPRRRARHHSGQCRSRDLRQRMRPGGTRRVPRGLSSTHRASIVMRSIRAWARPRSVSSPRPSRGDLRGAAEFGEVSHAPRHSSR